MLYRMPSHSYKTYAIRTPTSHRRRATCAEVDCLAYLNGWSFHLETLAALDTQLVYTALHSGKRFRKVSLGPGQTYLEFEAGQECFEGTAGRHEVQVRSELYVVGRGDHRTFNARTAYRHTRPELWVEDMAEHQDTLARAQN